MYRNNRLQDYNLIWEEKGIVLGIIFYIVENIENIRDVYIKDHHFLKIIKCVFPNINFHYRYKKKDENGLNIFIKTHKIKTNALIINNINNIKEIRTKQKNFYLLPWFNVNNPIVMFKYSKKRKEKNIETIKRKIHEFNHMRFNTYVDEQLPLINYKCGIVFWDIFTEYQILNAYSEIYRTNINVIYDFLNKYINSFNCSSVTPLRYIAPIYIQNEERMGDNDNSNNKFFSTFLHTVNKKLSGLNNILATTANV